MRYVSKRLLSTIALILILSSFIACQPVKSDIDKAKETVLLWFNYYADNPFSPKSFRLDLYHEDFSEPGTEGVWISIIERNIEFIEAKILLGNQNIIRPHEEELIQIVVKLKQIFFIDNTNVINDQKENKIIFYLSKFETDGGKYSILSRSYVGYSICFEDAIKKYFNSPGGRIDRPILRKALIQAGMEGLN